MRAKSGYRIPSEYVYRAFTVAFSLVALVFALPLMIIIGLMIWVIDGRPIFYSSVRLSKNKRPFTMYKFRTLVTDAEERIGAQFFEYALSSNRLLLNKTGRFLRETRLDELPQFINTLRGDMDLIGPRPIRPEQYEKACKNIPGFDLIFTVRPGLIGYAQIFTPHTAPKRIRAYIDHSYLKRKHRYFSELVLVTVTLVYIFFRMLRRAVASAGEALRLMFTSRRERRALRRYAPLGVSVTVRLADEPDAATQVVPLLDLNEEALAVEAAELPTGALSLEMRIPVAARRRRPASVKVAKCVGEIFAAKIGAVDGKRTFVLKYRPLSPFNSYLLHQYLMGTSIMNR
jgi:lipopolysaccharide/colanic/teichoic acid biosynthesis glycosyltransferase